MSPVSSNQDNEKSIEPNSKSFKNVYEKDHKPTSYLETMMHALKANVGTGCFALGAAFKHGGIILGPILLAVIAIICLHGQQMLVKSADFLREKNNLEVALTYAETVEMSFLNSNSEKWRKWAPAMKKICNVFICLTQFGFCCVYLLFVASNIKEIGDFHGIVWNIHVWITIAVVPIWLSTMIRTLKILGKRNYELRLNFT